MKLLALITTTLLFMSGLALAAPVNEDRVTEEELINIGSLTALATLHVVEEATQRSVGTAMYDYFQDGDDLVLRKRPGRATYGDITLKKGYRCGVNDCDDGDVDVRPEVRMNKAELVEATASRSGLSKAHAEKALEAFAESEVKALKKGEDVKLVGIGSFYQEYCSTLPRRGPREMSKKTACGTPSDYLDADGDGYGLTDEVGSMEGCANGCTEKFQMIATTVQGTKSPNSGSDNWIDRCTPERCGPRADGNPQTGKEIKIPAKNVARENGASGEMTVGEKLEINLPNGRRIIREVGGKK